MKKSRLGRQDACAGCISGRVELDKSCRSIVLFVIATICMCLELPSMSRRSAVLDEKSRRRSHLGTYHTDDMELPGIVTKNAPSITIGGISSSNNFLLTEGVNCVELSRRRWLRRRNRWNVSLVKAFASTSMVCSTVSLTRGWGMFMTAGMFFDRKNSSDKSKRADFVEGVF